MSNINVRDAVEALRPLVRQAKATLALSTVLEPLVGLEDYARELVGTVEARKAALAATDSRIDQAEAEAVRVCAAAKEQAEKVIGEANRTALETVTAAEAEALAERQAAKNFDSEVRAQASVVSDRTDALKEEIVLLEAKRDAIKAEIESFKAAASRVLG